jgi:beta-glucanase (GH16 family)
VGVNRWRRVALGIAFVAAVTFALGGEQRAAEPSAAQWKLVWADEFDGKGIDRTKWDFDLGNRFFNRDLNTWVRGWGNDELQYYTREPENAFVKDGMLHIRALKESYNGCAYTSARLKSRKRDGSPLFSKRYGKFEFRAKLPTGQGLWPALWLLPQDERYGGWAASGEIDVVEARGQEPTKVLGTLNFGGRWPANTHVSRDYVLPGRGAIADFHVYGLEWEPGEVRWSVDGRRYAAQSFWWSSSKADRGRGQRPASEADLNPWPAPFDQPFYLLMNVAVGGKFPGNPDQTTAFPAEMVVDYVRVYDRVGGYGKAKPRGEGKFPFGKP